MTFQALSYLFSLPMGSGMQYCSNPLSRKNLRVSQCTAQPPNHATGHSPQLETQTSLQAQRYLGY